MGGNALKNVETRRYQREEYFKLESEVLAKLKQDFPGRRIEAIRAYREKESFGDMDILFENDNIHRDLCNYQDLGRYVSERFKSKQVVQNGGVVSFEFNQFQIDLIGTPASNFETSVSYFAWNDLGNLMGRIAHKLGFTYGHDGLSMVFRDGTYQYAKITVSKDPKEIVEFLGYDYDRFAKGFDTVQGIYDFTVSTEFFNKEIYLLDNRNHASRTRDKKRKTYSDFLVWLETAELPFAYPWEVLKEQGGRTYKQQFAERAFKIFPNFKQEHDKVLEQFKLWKIFKTNFNGELVSEWTGLTAKDLGNFMKFIREEHIEVFGKEAFMLFVAAAGEEGTKKWLMPIFNEYKKENQ